MNKLAFVQTFLTKLRNRCTEVETLASGPGIVFSMKDFNECLQVFCQGLLKHCECELRTRVETYHIRQNQYQHLLYMKDKQALYYRRKCEQFLGDIDKLVNAKIASKGSQLIYGLDVASRELGVLRDNYRLMQSMMMEELRHEYIKAIEEKNCQITSLKGEKDEEKRKVETKTLAAMTAEFRFLDEKVAEQRKEVSKEMSEGLNKPPVATGRKQEKEKEKADKEKAERRDEVSKKIEHFNANRLEEVQELRRQLRQCKADHLMETVLAQERHEKELAN